MASLMGKTGTNVVRCRLAAPRIQRPPSVRAPPSYNNLLKCNCTNFVKCFSRRSISSVRRCPTRASAEGPLSSLSLGETAALDELIDSLLGSKDANDLSRKVAENALSFDQSFWLRLAARADSAQDEEEKERLASLATVVMQIVDAMVKKTDEQLVGSSEVLQRILKAGADENTGEWQVPLQDDKLAAMEVVMEENSDMIDEAFLSSCFAWMKKVSDDNLDGMVLILQNVLQLYAARELTSSRNGQEEGAEAQLLEILSARESAWTPMIQEKLNSGLISKESFTEALQRKMETVVLSLASGSYAQRVQAEYLKELETRANAVFEDK